MTIRILLQSHAEFTYAYRCAFLICKAPSKIIWSKEVSHSTHLDFFLNFTKHVCTLGNTVNPFPDPFLTIKRKCIFPKELEV